MYLKSCLACHTPELDAAVEKGIRAREAKAKVDRRRRETGVEERDREWLTASARRLKRLVDWVESCGQADLGNDE